MTKRTGRATDYTKEQNKKHFHKDQSHTYINQESFHDDSSPRFLGRCITNRKACDHILHLFFCHGLGKGSINLGPGPLLDRRYHHYLGTTGWSATAVGREQGAQAAVEI
jgi:hypothetical protein